MNVPRGLWNIAVVGTVALFWIAVMKLVFVKYNVPGLSDIVAIV